MIHTNSKELLALFSFGGPQDNKHKVEYSVPDGYVLDFRNALHFTSNIEALNE